MSAAALQPSDQLWAEMRRAGQLFFSVGYPYHSRYLAQPERAGFMLWRNEWGQVLMSITGPCKGKRQWQKTVVEGWRQALEVIPADLFAWGPLLRDFGDYGTTYALHKLGRISACDTRVAIAEMTTIEHPNRRGQTWLEPRESPRTDWLAEAKSFWSARRGAL